MRDIILEELDNDFFDDEEVDIQIDTEDSIENMYDYHISFMLPPNAPQLFTDSDIKKVSYFLDNCNVDYQVNPNSPKPDFSRSIYFTPQFTKLNDLWNFLIAFAALYNKDWVSVSLFDSDNSSIFNH